MPDYQPIPCAQHDRLELAAIRRTPLRITYMQDEVFTVSRIFVTDISTRDGAEWLHFLSDATGQTQILRLDQIRAIQELPPSSPEMPDTDSA